MDFGTAVEGIHSIKTFDVYKGHCERFTAWCIENKGFRFSMRLIIPFFPTKKTTYLASCLIRLLLLTKIKNMKNTV